MRQRFVLLTASVLTLSFAALHAQGVTKETVAGVTNFARLETTIACAGVTTPEALAGLKKMGYASVVNLRAASEAGAGIDAEAAAAKAAGVHFIHLPFSVSSPDPKLVDNFLKAITDPANQPAFVHCASGNRAAALWMIKRIEVDKWDVDRAEKEAIALGMTSPAMKTFVMNHLQSRQH